MRKTFYTLILSFFCFYSYSQFDCQNAKEISCGNIIEGNNSTDCFNTYKGPYCDSDDKNYFGKEKVYRFHIYNDTTVRIGLTNLTSDLDLFLFRSCSPGDCISSSHNPGAIGYEFISAAIDSGSYYIVVDGWGGASSEYKLYLDCIDIPAQPDCLNSESISCGQTISSHTNTGTDINDGPYCNAYCNYSGMEKVYKFAIDITSDITITATGLTGDLDMFLLNSCDRKNCVAASGAAGNNPESITKTLNPGTYYIILDGYQGASSPFNISLSCTTINDGLNCNNLISSSYSGDGSNLKFNYKFNGGSNTQFVGWRVNGMLLSNHYNVNFIFPSAGTYEVCSEFINLNTGQLESCCKTACIDLPTTCEDLINYEYVDGHFELSLNTDMSTVTNLVWNNDTDGVEIDPNHIPASCRNLLITVRYFDTATDCWVLCCRRISFCAPTSCQDYISSSFDPIQNQYTFHFSYPYASNILWKFDETNEVLPNGQYTLPPNWTCTDRTATIYYYDLVSKCWRICCKTFNICPPQNCQSNIGYDYEADDNKFVFTLDNSAATNLIWNLEEIDQTLPNGEFVIPSGWVCQDLTVSVTYFDPSSQCWRVCSKVVTICPPISCETAINYEYIASNNSYQFTLDIPGATNLYWKFDETNSHLPNGQFIIPAGWQCQDLTVSVYYFDTNSQCWRVCCKKVTICPPINCETAIDYQYIASNNSYQFTLDIPGATNLYWKFDETNTHLPNGQFVIPDDWQCQDLTVSVYYFDTTTQCWRVCCRKVTICPPINCETAIDYQYIASNNSYQFTLDIPGATNLYWKFEETNTPLPNGQFVIPDDWQCQDLTVSVYYFDATTQCWRVCCRKVTICPPINCETAIDYQYIASNNSYQFTLEIPGATNLYWKFEETNTPLPNGQFVIPAGWVCKDRTVSVYYFDINSQCWRVCCKKVTICPPTNCETNILYSYHDEENKFVFDLDIANATNIVWKFDETNQVIPNGEFILPDSWTCTDLTVTAYYFDTTTQCWRSCCRKINICPPNNCHENINFEYDPSGNFVTFSYDSGNPQHFSWTIEETQTHLGSDHNLSDAYAVPNPCKEQTVAARYFENGAWQYCEKKIYLCNPYDCSNMINHTVSGNTLSLSVDNQFNDVSWFDAQGNHLGSGNQINYPVPIGQGNISVTVIYKDESTNCYRTCHKDIEISCNLPEAAFTYNISGAGVYFTNTTVNGDSYLWDFDGGIPIEGSTSSSQNPVVLYSSGNYNVCLTATNICGDKIYCQQFEIDNSHGCNFDIADDICGYVGDEVLVPITISNFNDVISCNFTVTCDNSHSVEILGIEEFTPSIASGSNYYFEPDHLRFFWSNTSSISLDDNTTIFKIRVKLIEATEERINFNFSNNPVNTEAFNGDFESIPMHLVSGSVCVTPTPQHVSIKGQVMKPQSLDPIVDAQVQAVGTTIDQMTDNNGNYVMEALSFGNDYTLKPYKNTGIYNGLNAIDIVKLHRHILQLTEISSPYEMIAADVNNDQLINALDVVIMQRIQLRLIDEFPNNTSWRFIPTAYNFNSNDPLSENYPEEINFPGLQSDYPNADFYGVKVGDLDLSSDPSQAKDKTSSHNRNSLLDTLSLTISTIYSTEGDDLISVPVVCSGFNNISGVEGSIIWDTDKLRLVGYSDFAIPTWNEDNFGQPNSLTNGLTFNWTDGSLDGTSLTDGTALFNLVFEPKGEIGEITHIEFRDNPLPVFASNNQLSEITVDYKNAEIAFVSKLTAISSVINVSCHGGSNGEINVSANGATGNYTYLWNNGETTANLSGLNAGNYSCLITDIYSGSTYQISETITSPEALTIDFGVEQTDETSAATANVSGGTSPYQYQWSTEETTQTIDELEDGQYHVTITDHNDCIVRASIDIINSKTSSTEEEVVESSEGSFLVYPNPSTDGMITIESDVIISQGTRWELFNDLGEMIISGELGNQSLHTLNLKHLSAGVYYLQILNDEISQTTPIFLIK